MPYIAPSTEWFIISHTGMDEYYVEWCDELNLEHGLVVRIQPTVSLYRHFKSIDYTNLTTQNLSLYLEKVIEANNTIN